MSGGEISAHAVADGAARRRRLVGDAAVLEMVEALHLDAVGAGPLEPLLRRPGVTDVLVNGHREVYVDAGDGLRLSRRPRLPTTQRCAGWPSGWRRRPAGGSTTRRPSSMSGCATAPASTRCWRRWRVPARACRLRVPTRRALTLDQLIASRMVDAETGQLLLDLVAAKVAFVISGGTGSGKTTLLAALLSHVATDAAASSSSRMPPSCGPTIRTWSRSKRGRPTSRARAR